MYIICPDCQCHAYLYADEYSSVFKCGTCGLIFDINGDEEDW